MPDLQPGAVFAGHRIESVAGRGGMGTVYRATHIALDHVVALKAIAADLAGDDAFRERFKSESRIAVSLRHPNVVPIHHAGEEDGLLFVTMDLIDGPDLHKLLLQRGSLEPAAAISILKQVAAALDVAHSRGLVHRDIKPGNILIETRPGGDHAYLTDFGLTKRMDQASAASGLTSTGAFVGTLDYVAPEQIRGERLDARTDVYALGCVLYEMLAGTPPFADREEKVAKMYAHLQDDLPWLPGEEPLIQELDAVIARATAKDRDGRYPSAGDLARAAAAAVSGSEVNEQERSVGVGPAAPTEAYMVPDETQESAGPATAPASSPGGIAETAPGTAPAAGPATAPAESAADTAAAAPAAPPPAAPARPAGREAETTAAPKPAARPRNPLLALIGFIMVAGLVAAAVLVLKPDNGPTTEQTSPGSNGGSNGSGGSDQTLEAGTLDGSPTPVAGLPVGVFADADAVWVATRDSGELVRLSPRNGKVTGGPLPLFAGAEGLASADGAVWVALSGADTVARVPIGSDTFDSYATGPMPRAVLIGDGSVWISNNDGSTVTRLGLDGSLIADITVGTAPHGLAFADDGTVWVSNRVDGTISRIDPATNATVGNPIGVGTNPKGIAIVDGKAWVANTDDGTLSVIDVATGRVDPQTVEVGGDPRGVVFGFGSLWVSNGGGSSDDGYVTRIDPATRETADTDVPGSPEGLSVGKDLVWVTTGSADSIVRIKP